jgi:hypothetical protein
MINEDLKTFMDHIKVLNKDMSEYKNEEKGINFLVPNGYMWARCDYLELTNDELKREKFNQNINNEDIKFNYVESTRPAPKYEQTKVEADKYVIVDAKVKVNQVWLVSNGLKYKNTFNNKEEAMKLVESINSKLKGYLE